jgi:hypothetical protein
MIFMSLFYNPIYFARIGTYFSVLNAIIIPKMLDVIYRKNINKNGNKLIFYLVFIVYLFLDLTKLGSISIFTDLFNHISLFDLL